jgi:hypothetical protein
MYKQAHNSVQEPLLRVVILIDIFVGDSGNQNGRRYADRYLLS